jgi:OmpA-OmpF porin, OOP family
MRKFLMPRSLLVLAALWWTIPAAAQDPFGADEFGEDEFGPAPEAPQAEPGPPPPSEPPAREPEARGQGAPTGAQDDPDAPPAPEEGVPAPVTGDPADEADADRERDLDRGPVAEEDEALRARRFRSHNTLRGPVGGLRVVDAGSGPAGTFRVQFGTEFFIAKDYLRPDDRHDSVGATLSLSWSVIEHLELFASVSAYANNNTFGDPSLLQVVGDTLFGVKGYHSVTPWLTLGGDVSAALLNTVGDIGVVFESTSFGFRGNATADLQALDNPLPLIFRFNLQYWFDNSAKLIENVENQRYLRLPLDRAADPANEWRHLVLPEERLGLGINRMDFVNLAFGVEAPIRVTDDFYISPILEWLWEIPSNRQGYSCLVPPGAELGAGPRFGHDSCLALEGAKAFHHTLTLGVRVLPPVKGLALFAGADVGLTGTSTFVRELAPNVPYNIMLGASYAYDTRPEVKTVVHEVDRTVEVAAPEAVQGRVRGTVVEQGTDQAVAGAVVAFPNRELNAILASDAGQFTTYPFDPGSVEMRVTHPDYESGTCVATIPDERPTTDAALVVETRCEVAPRATKGDVQGRVTNVDGDAVGGAEVQITGASKHDLTTDDKGRFQLQGVPPGQYTVLVQDEKHLVKLDQFEVTPRETTDVVVQLVPRPSQPMVRVRQRQIVIRRQVNFATGSAEILPNSAPLLAEVADVLIRNPHLERIEVQGHTDNRGGAQLNKRLSQERADSVRLRLIEHGVDSDRLEANGYGETRPLVPNITAANRARNRRVQFMITERGEPEED